MANHDDYCSACSGGGMMVLCEGDGCKRSYHWLCLDPPRLEADVDETEPVFCNSCAAVMRTATKKSSGTFEKSSEVFGPLLSKLERKNPVSFRLSKEVTGYFDGVKVGPQGEFEEILPPSQRPK